LRNATLQLDATDAGGEARLGIQSGAIELPGVFDDPVLGFDQLAAQVSWKIEPAPAATSRGSIATSGPAAPPKITVQVKDASFANPDAQGEFKASWSTGAGVRQRNRCRKYPELDPHQHGDRQLSEVRRSDVG